MMKLSKLNSDGSSSSSHNSSRNSLEFASPSSQTFSPAKSPQSIADHSIYFNSEKPSLKLVLKKNSDNQYQVKNFIPPSFYSDRHVTLFSNATNVAEQIHFEPNLKTRPKRNIPVKRYSKEVFATTSEESNDRDFVESNLRSKKRKLLQSNPNNNFIKKPRPKINKSKTLPPITKAKHVPVKLYLDEKAEVLEPFFKSDLQHRGFEEKVKILFNEPKVALQVTKLGLVLCEEGSNVIRSKAILHFHLFISNTSPCIYCPYCNVYLSVNEFSKHVHITIDDIDDPFDSDEQKAAKKIIDNHKLNILPYTVNDELNKFELEIWELFSKKYMLFKNKAKKDIDPKNLNSDTKETKAKKECDSKCGQINKNNKSSVDFYSALSDDDFENKPSEFFEKQVSQERVTNLIEFENFKEDIILSEEE